MDFFRDPIGYSAEQIKPKKSKFKKNPFTDPFVGAVQRWSKPPGWAAPLWGKKFGWNGAFSKYDKIVDRGIDPPLFGAQSKSAGKSMISKRSYKSKGAYKKKSYKRKSSYGTKRYSAKKKRKTHVQGISRFRKVYKSKKLGRKYSKRTYVDSGLIERDNAVYYQLPDFSATDRLFSAVGEACARAVSDLCDFKALSIRDAFPAKYSKIRLDFKAIRVESGSIWGNSVGETLRYRELITTGKDYGDICNWFTDVIKAFASYNESITLAGEPTGDSLNDIFAGYPAICRIFNDDNQAVHTLNRFYDTVVDLKCTQVIKFQNISPVPGTEALQVSNAIGVNALKGKHIVFKDHEPRVRDELIENGDISEAMAVEFQSNNAQKGHKVLSDASVGSYNNFAKIRDPRSIFSNVHSIGWTNLGVNAIKSERVTFTCRHTLKTFVKMFGATRWDHGHFGKNHMFCFELLMPENALTTNKVKLEFTRNTVYYAYAKLGREAKPLPRIEQVIDNFL